MGAFMDGEWESICKLFTVEESPDLFLEYYSPSSFSNESCGLISSVNNENSSSSLSGWISNPPNMFLETTNHTNSNSNNNDAEKFLPDFLSCMDFTNMNEENDASLGVSIAHETLNNSPTFKRNREEETNSVEPAKKNARISKVVQKGKRKAGSKIDGVNQDLINKESNNPDSNSDDSNICSASEEMNETEDSNSNSNSNTTVSLTSTGKKRASRGAATDPQSLYARKRRMRINERLRILQSLVPNGTKVDISTMLEEAFHYVKFLQLQIRMLSSDELWMYAPLAYNGIDIGAYRRMPHPFLGL